MKPISYRPKCDRKSTGQGFGCELKQFIPNTPSIKKHFAFCSDETKHRYNVPLRNAPTSDLFLLIPLQKAMDRPGMPPFPVKPIGSQRVVTMKSPDMHRAVFFAGFFVCVFHSLRILQICKINFFCNFAKKNCTYTDFFLQLVDGSIGHWE